MKMFARITLAALATFSLTAAIYACDHDKTAAGTTAEAGGCPHAQAAAMKAEGKEGCSHSQVSDAQRAALAKGETVTLVGRVVCAACDLKSAKA